VLTEQKRRTQKKATGPSTAAEPPQAEPRWLLLFHQIPPQPAYLRVKIGRHLARIGAVQLKSTIYVLPRSDGRHEDFQWVMREVTASGGEATLCEARFVEGLSDTELERRFQEARDEDYATLAEEVRKVAALDESELGHDKLKADLQRFEKRLEEIGSIDFFSSSGREAVVGLLGALRVRLEERKEPRASHEGVSRVSRGDYAGKVWVTRTGVHVDRIASAWLVKRFVDPEAAFKFVPPRGYHPLDGELRFDMFDAEFTHEGDLCTFEVLMVRLGIDEPGLRAVAEIIHDIDLKDSKFGRPETAGIAALIAGMCIESSSDLERLEHGFALFDQLTAYFARKKNQT
jgi:hypothetical protein